MIDQQQCWTCSNNLYSKQQAFSNEDIATIKKGFKSAANKCITNSRIARFYMTSESTTTTTKMMKTVTAIASMSAITPNATDQYKSRRFCTNDNNNRLLIAEAIPATITNTTMAQHQRQHSTAKKRVSSHHVAKKRRQLTTRVTPLIWLLVLTFAWSQTTTMMMMTTATTIVSSTPQQVSPSSASTPDATDADSLADLSISTHDLSDSHGARSRSASAESAATSSDEPWLLSSSSSSSSSTTTARLEKSIPYVADADLETTMTTAHDNDNDNNNNNHAEARVARPTLKPINHTLVDETFGQQVSDDEMVRRWRNMDAQLQAGIKSILKLIFPTIVAVSQDAKVSGDCSGGILKWILSLRNLKSWAVKMLDASGKPTAAMFDGSLSMFGSARQCLAIRAPDEDEMELSEQFEEYFRGQYCVLEWRPWLSRTRPFYALNATMDALLQSNNTNTFNSNTNKAERSLYDELADIGIVFNFLTLRFDLCVPSTCSLDDIQRVAEFLGQKIEMRAKVTRCHTEPRASAHTHTGVTWWFANNTAPVVVSACVLLTMLLIVVCGTCCDLWHTQYNSALPNRNGRTNNNNNNYVNDNNYNNASDNKWIHLIRTTSLRKSLKTFSRHAIEDERAAHKPPLSLYGVRTVLVCWFCLVQLSVNLNYQFLRDSLTLRNLVLNHWTLQLLINSTMQFDSLILITAFTMAYTQSAHVSDHVRHLVRYVADKWARLAPAIVAVMALTVLTPLLALQTPVWYDYVSAPAAACSAPTSAFANLLFLQNFLNFEHICLPHTWLLCVELQLCCLAVPLLVWLKAHYKRYELSAATTTGDSQLSIKQQQQQPWNSGPFRLCYALIALGWFANFVTTYVHQLPPAWFYTFPDARDKAIYMSTHLFKTWTHLAPFAMGLLAGYLCKARIQLARARHHLLLYNNELAKKQQNTQTNNNNSNNKDTLHCSHHHAKHNLKLHQALYSVTLLSRLTWAALATLMVSLICSTFYWSTQQLPTPLTAAFYDATCRCVWSALMVCCLTYVCDDKHINSSVTRALSHCSVVCLGKLSFLAYLIYPYVHMIVMGSQEQPIYSSMLIMFHVFVGNLILTYTIALLVSLFVEQPFRRLIGKLLLGHNNYKIDISSRVHHGLHSFNDAHNTSNVRVGVSMAEPSISLLFK